MAFTQIASVEKTARKQVNEFPYAQYKSALKCFLFLQSVNTLTMAPSCRASHDHFISQFITIMAF